MVYLMVLSTYLPGQTEENHEDLSQDSRWPGQDSNWVPLNLLCWKVQWLTMY